MRLAKRSDQESRPVRRVLHIFHSLGMGGAETWLVAMLEWLEQYGHTLPVEVHVDVCLTGGKREVFDDRVRALGANLHYLRFGRTHLGSFVRRFRQLLANGQYDALHDHANYAGGLHLLCGLGRLPQACVVHVHSPLSVRDRSPLRRVTRYIGRQAVLRLASAVVGTSLRILREYELAPAIGLTQRRLAIHCGFDLTPFAEETAVARAAIRAEFGWNSDAILLLFVGRLEAESPQKNPRIALDIARECIAKNPRVKALLVGAGDTPRRQIEAELASEGLADAIRLPGIRFDVPRLMVASDLLLFPSVKEGLGMVVVEAQAAGLRILASDTTPDECVVVPGMVTFVSLAESPAQWAHRALSLLQAPPIDRDACRGDVSRSPFSIENSVMALLEVYGFVPQLPL